MSRAVEVVKACQPHFKQTHHNYKTPDLFWREYSLSRTFTYLIMHNYRSNQSALVTRFGTDLCHEYGIFGGQSQMSFSRNATRAGSKEGRLFLQVNPWSTDTVYFDIVYLLHLDAGARVRLKGFTLLLPVDS